MRLSSMSLDKIGLEVHGVHRFARHQRECGVRHVAAERLQKFIDVHVAVELGAAHQFHGAVQEGR